MIIAASTDPVPCCAKFLLTTVLLATAFVLPAYSQGFMVRPLSLKAAVAPNRSKKLSLQVRNTTPDKTQQVEFRLIELGQNPEGGWQPLDDDSAEKNPKLASCRKWLTLNNDSLEILPAQTKDLTLNAQVPPDARGTYFAGILAEPPAPDASDGIAVRVRFLVPIIITVSGRHVRHDINISDMNLLDGVQAPGSDATALSVTVKNNGRTFSRIRNSLSLDVRWNEKWRRIKRVDLEQKSIIPGVEIGWQHDLAQRLPSGKYRLRCALYVDDRRTRTAEKILTFQGADSADTLALDSPLILNTNYIFMKAAPGGMQTAALTLENTSEQQVSITVASAAPPQTTDQKQKEPGSASASWLTASPKTLVLRAGTRQTVRVVARMPQNEASPSTANRYGILFFNCTFEDDQDAGSKEVLVQLNNTEGTVRRHAEVDLQITSSDGDGQRLHVQCRNSGNVHLEPHCRIVVQNGWGEEFLNQELTGNAGLLLPQQTAVFSGNINARDIPPGSYVMLLRLYTAKGEEIVRRRKTIEVMRSPKGPMIAFTSAQQSVVTEENRNKNGGDDEGQRKE